MLASLNWRKIQSVGLQELYVRPIWADHSPAILYNLITATSALPSFLFYCAHFCKEQHCLTNCGDWFRNLHASRLFSTFPVAKHKKQRKCTLWHDALYLWAEKVSIRSYNAKFNFHHTMSFHTNTTYNVFYSHFPLRLWEGERPREKWNDKYLHVTYILHTCILTLM